MFWAFFEGIVIGFLIAMPVGPIGLLCIRHALLHGFGYGMIVGLGAACADAVYGLIAACGVSCVATVLTDYYLWLHLLGALFLCYLGFALLLAKSTTAKADVAKAHPVALFISIFFLTLTNPLTILFFAGVYTGLGIDVSAEKYWFSVLLVIGVFLGSILWWLMLSTAAAFFGRRWEFTSTSILNKISGGLILGFGVVALIPLVTPWLFS